MVRRPMAHQAIVSRKAPRPTGPYSQAIAASRVGDMLFVSGQLPYEVPHGSLFSGPIKRQAELALGHLKNIVLDARFNVAEIVKVTIYLTDLKHEAAVDAAYNTLFVGLTPPARVLVEVSGLRGGAGIEVEAIAVRQAPPQAPVDKKKDEEEEDLGMY